MSLGFWGFDRLSRALGSGPKGPQRIRGISTDTRTLRERDVFVALRGENYDGHDYVPEAVARGAAAVVVSSVPRSARPGVAVYEVDDTLVALGKLGACWRRAWGGTLVAIAGSNGKTSTKDLAAAALGSRFTVHATAGNLNNRVGVPLTLLAMPPEAEVAVIEMGTSLPGEIAILREIACPDISVVTCVSEEHLEGLGDIEGVLREETSIYDGARIAVAPADQEAVVAAARARAHEVVSAGLDDGDLRASAWRIDEEGTGFLEVDGQPVRVPLRGVHNLRNTLLALAVARACGVPLFDSARGIAALPQPRMRTAWESYGRATVINDAYNSNPGSARAAIELLRAIPGPRQKVIIIGTMRELGLRSTEYHDQIAGLALKSADVVAGVGEFAPALERLPHDGTVVVTATEVDALWPALEPHLATDALILLKASRGVRLERIVPLIQAWAGRPA